MNASLNEKLRSVKWGGFKLGTLFDIESTLSFNADKLTEGSDFDYVTRTSSNQGILKQTGFVNEENINPAGTWSLGLLQMDFFYRNKPWYAGQFVRKITPRFEVPEKAVLFFTTLLNRQKAKLLSVLVRDVDKIFKEITISLPVQNGKIDFAFMESFISELEAERIAELSAYLTVSGLDNYELSGEEERAIDAFENIEFEEFDVTEIFDVKNTSNILSEDIIENSGTTPYLCASSENNSVSSYISYNEKYLEKGNCVFIGGKTFVVSYQERDFFSNDSHNLALYLKNYEANKLDYLYLSACVYKSLSFKYSWGDSVSKTKIQTDKVMLPARDHRPDFASLSYLIKAIQKLVIKDVVCYADRQAGATKKNTESRIKGRK